MAEEGAATANGTEGKDGDPPSGEGKGGEGGKPDDGTLGPEGEKALEAFKDRARKAEREKKDLEERLNKLEEENKTESEKAIDKARKEAKSEAEQGFEKERRSDRLKVAVSKRARELADIDDVVLNLKQGETDDLFDSDGQIKDDALKERIDKLLKSKPHLKASGAGKPLGSANGGEGGGGEGGDMNTRIRQKARA